MKKVALFLSLSIVIIAGIIVHLMRSGISLRSEPLIKPTVVDADHRNVAAHFVLRLYPELLNTHYLIFGILPETEESQRVLSLMTEEFFKLIKQPVQILRNAETLSAAEIAACHKPCWLLVDRQKANQLTPNEFIDQKIRPLNQPFMNLTYVPFRGDEEVSDFCNNEKRLTLECLGPVAVRDVHRKLKDHSQRYFFLRKYNNLDYFLFVQSPLEKKI